MLKLFKYDFRAIKRRLIPLYLVAIIIGVVNQICTTFVIRLSMTASQENASFIIFSLLKMVFSLSFFLIMSYASILTIFILIMNFNNSVYGNEGYLINSLPISSKKLILAKYLNFIFWTFISAIFYIVFYIIGTINGLLASGQSLKVINSELNELKMQLFHSPYFGKFVGVAIIVLICIILQHLLNSWVFMMCVTFANLVKSNKLVMGIVTYVVTNIILGIFYFSLMASFLFKLNSDIEIRENAFFGLMTEYGITYIVFAALLNVGIFFLINYIHSKKIDLE